MLPVKAEKVGEVEIYLDKSVALYAQVLPKHVTPQRLVRSVILACQKAPSLLAPDVDRESLFVSVMRGAMLGLEMDGQEAALVPYRNPRGGKSEVQLIPMFKGVEKLARQSGEIVAIEPTAVYDGEPFVVRKGTIGRGVEHSPRLDVARTDDHILAVYAVAFYRNGHQQFEVMDRDEIERVRKSSRAKSGPWFDNWGEMAKKTVVHRLCKHLPQSQELRAALEIESQAEEGKKGDIPIADDWRDAPQLGAVSQGALPPPAEEMPSNGAGGAESSAAAGRGRKEPATTQGRAPSPAPAEKRSLADIEVAPNTVRYLGRCSAICPMEKRTKSDLDAKATTGWFAIEGVDGLFISDSNPERQKFGLQSVLQGAVTEKWATTAGKLRARVEHVRRVTGDPPRLLDGTTTKETRAAAKESAPESPESDAAASPEAPTSDAAKGPLDYGVADLTEMPLSELVKACVAAGKAGDGKAYLDACKRVFGTDATGAVKSPYACAEKDKLVEFYLAVTADPDDPLGL